MSLAVSSSASCACSTSGRNLVLPARNTLRAHRRCYQAPCRQVSEASRSRLICSASLSDPPQLPAYASPYADPDYIKEYEYNKAWLLDTTRKCGGVFAAYLLLTYDGEAAICALAGAAASYLYLQTLFRDLDSYNADTVVAVAQAKLIENPMVSRVALIIAAYRQALAPRLLIPVALAAGSAAYNAAFPEAPIDIGHQGCLLLGFLSYKGALVIKLVDELTPKTINDGKMTRPIIEKFDQELELDRWGRPKQPIAPSPTDVIPEDQRDVSKVPLAQLLLAADETAEAPSPSPSSGSSSGSSSSGGNGTKA